MSQHVHFHYAPIGPPLYERLFAHLIRQESFTLLGPRSVGKRHTIERVAALYALEGLPFVHAEMVNVFPFCSESEVLDNLRANTGADCLRIPEDIAKFADLFRWMQTQASQERPLVLLMANLDQMAEALLAHFLHNLRSAVDAGYLVVGITGEGDLSGLVHGLNSPFACAHQYVLHYHDQESFRWFYDRFCEGVRLPEEFHAQPDPCSTIYNMTGGDIRLLHHTILAQSTRLPKRAFVPLGDDFLSFPQPRVWGLEPFVVIQRYADSLMPDDLPVLRDLVQSKHGCFLPPTNRGVNGIPHPLELMGLARRDEEDGQRIKLASHFIDTFAKQYFSNTRLGDLFAKADRWDEAFRCYELVTQEGARLRPISSSDYPITKDLIECLCGKLIKPVILPYNASQVLSEVSQTLSQGLRLILGHTHVSFCRYDRELGIWLSAETAKPAQEGAWLEQIGVRHLDISQWVGEVGGNYHTIIAAESQRLFAVVVTNPARVRVPRHHKELTLRILQRFTHIWRHAQNVLWTENRLVERQEIMGVTSDVLAELGREVIDVRQALHQVCDKLVEKGRFKRVAWFHCRPDRKSLQKVAEKCLECPELPVLYEIAIDDGDYLAANCFAEALRKGKALVERAPKKSSLYPKEIRDLVEAPCVVVPVHDEHENPVGVMLAEAVTAAQRFGAIERDLFDLGKRVSILIRQAERMEKVRKVMNAIADPLIILGSDGRVQFVNHEAAVNLGLEALEGRWINQQQTIKLEDTKMSEDLRGGIAGLIDPESERNRSMRVFHEGGTMKFWNVTATPVNDWFGLPGGHLVRLRNRTTVRATFDALYQVGAAANVSEALDQFFRAAEKLAPTKPKMARFYSIAEDDPNVLVSTRSTGFKDPMKHANFESGKIRLRRDASTSAMAVLPQGDKPTAPMIWQWRSDCTEGETRWTSKGLGYRMTKDGYYANELEQEDGDFWIDFPLYVKHRDTDSITAIGKICLSFSQGDELVTPEAFEYLTWMASVIGRFLGGLTANESRLQEVTQAEEKALAVASHNIATMVAGLSTFRFRYADIADSLLLALKRARGLPSDTNAVFSALIDSFLELNLEMRRAQKDIDNVLARMKDRLRGISIAHQKNVSLKKLLEDTATILPQWIPFTVEGDADVEVDRAYMLLAFQELMMDSLKYREPTRDLLITASITSISTSRVQIDYRDNGRGVPATMKERVFEAFFRGVEPTEGLSTGVGLYFVRNVIEAHGGFINETGEHGQGVCFSINIPISPK